MSADKLQRILKAREELRARFAARVRETPSLSDSRPLGTGPANAHGMPELPVGQTRTAKWPVLDLGILPEVPLEQWELRVDGACAAPFTLRFDELLALEQVDDVSDFHCVTTWSRLGLRWCGVRVSDLLALAEPSTGATHLMCHGYDEYSTNLALAEALKPDVLLVHRVDGGPLPREHGGPVRMITPQLYAWKGAKWIRRLELMIGDREGFWEERGYSMTAHPWRDDRYR